MVVPRLSDPRRVGRMSHPYYPSGNPHFNHVAMSMPADLLDESHRKEHLRLLGRGTGGFTEMPTMTDRP